MLQLMYTKTITLLNKLNDEKKPERCSVVEMMILYDKDVELDLQNPCMPAAPNSSMYRITPTVEAVSIHNTAMHVTMAYALIFFFSMLHDQVDYNPIYGTCCKLLHTANTI